VNLVFRLFAVVICAFFRQRIGYRDTSRLLFRVWPLDLDFNIHMTNSRYLSVMDLGRTDWFLRTGAWQHVRQAGINPVLGGSMIRFRRSLAPFERFTLTTRLLGWDEHWFYFEQLMSGRNGTACLALQRAGFTKAGRLVPAAALVERLAPGTPSPPLPSGLAEWNAADNAFAHTASG
jgi:acyl-CoA thioesterase FadM